MHPNSIRRSMIRLAGIMAVMAGLVLSGSGVSAMNVDVGFTECGNGECPDGPTREFTVVQPSEPACDPQNQLINR